MSRRDFCEGKVSEYRMTYNEILVVNSMAIQLNLLGETGRSIGLYKSIINSRENARTSEEDKAALFPAIMTNLSTVLGKVGRLKESLKYCRQALELCREYNNQRFVPELLYNIACCYHLMGEEAQIYKPYLIRAYHCAYALGDNNGANIIKKDAEKSFGILIP